MNETSLPQNDCVAQLGTELQIEHVALIIQALTYALDPTRTISPCMDEEDRIVELRSLFRIIHANLLAWNERGTVPGVLAILTRNALADDAENGENISSTFFDPKREEKNGRHEEDPSADPNPRSSGDTP